MELTSERSTQIQQQATRCGGRVIKWKGGEKARAPRSSREVRHIRKAGEARLQAIMRWRGESAKRDEARWRLLE